MGKRSGARGAGLVEYALLVVALMVGAAAAQKVIGHRITSAGNGALVALGGGGMDATNDDGELGTVTALPKVGTGPNATREEMKAADKNGDGVLSTEEQADLARSQEADQNARLADEQRRQDAAAQKAAVAKKRNELLDGIASKFRS